MSPPFLFNKKKKVLEINEILDFIQRRWKKDNDWTNGNCLWFTIILKIRFPQVQIYYLPIEGHFVVKQNDSFFDQTGEIFLQEKPILFQEIQKQDPVWFNHLIRDCFN